MCIVTTPDGTEIIVPEPVYLDSDNVNRTVNFLIAESKAYAEERRRKKELRKQKQKSFWKKH